MRLKNIFATAVASTLCLTCIACAQAQTSTASIQKAARELKRKNIAYNMQKAAYDARRLTQIPQINASTEGLIALRPQLEAKTRTLNLMNSGNLAYSPPGKAQIDAEVARLRKKHHAESGHRIGIHNPYDDSSYVRWYDDHFDHKDNLVVSQVQGSYKLLEQQRADWAKAYRRAADTADQLTREYNELAAAYGAIGAQRSELAAMKQEAERRLAQIGRAPVQRRPLAEPAPKGKGPYRIYLIRYGRKLKMGKSSASIAEAIASARRFEGTTGARIVIEDANGNVVKTLR